MWSIDFYRDLAKATCFAELALLLLDWFSLVEFFPRVHQFVYGFIYSWKKPIHTVLQPLLNAHRAAMQVGDVECGGLCANLYCYLCLESSANLGRIQQEWNGFMETMIAAKQQFAIHIFLPFLQMIHHLMGLTADPLASKGDLVDFDGGDNIAKERGTFFYAAIIKYCRMQLGYMFGDIAMAEKASLGFKDVMISLPLVARPTSVFFIGVVAVAMARQYRLQRFNNTAGNRRWLGLGRQYRHQPNISNRKKNHCLKKSKKAEKILKRYATLSPQNCLQQIHVASSGIGFFTGRTW